MSRSPQRLSSRLLLLLAALAAAAIAMPAAHASDGVPVAQGDEPASGPVVDILQVEGAIDPPVVAAIRDLTADAGERDSALLLIQLDSPGGLSVDREEVVGAIREAEIPVVVWVGPGAARARGAATFLTAAAGLSTIARDATLGPACPVAAGASACGAEDVVRLADLFADAASGAGQGGSEDLPVEEAWSADRAVDAGLVALTVDDYASLLQDLDGREVITASGARTLDLPEQDLTVRLHTLGLLRRILHASLNPVLVAFLLVGLLLLIAFEVFQPGFGVAGVAALLVAPLLIYGLVVMPVTWWAVALLVVGAVFLGIDLAIAGLGPPTFLGAGATVAGLWWLFPDGSPILHVPTWVNVLLAAFTVSYFVVIMTIVLRAQGGPELDTAAEELVGEVGVVRSTMNPEGHVFVAGALWRARWTGPDVGRVKTGTTVRVSDVDGAVLLVEPSDREPARS